MLDPARDALDWPEPDSAGDTDGEGSVTSILLQIALKLAIMTALVNGLLRAQLLDSKKRIGEGKSEAAAARAGERRAGERLTEFMEMPLSVAYKDANRSAEEAQLYLLFLHLEQVKAEESISNLLAAIPDVEKVALDSGSLPNDERYSMLMERSAVLFPAAAPGRVDRERIEGMLLRVCVRAGFPATGKSKERVREAVSLAFSSSSPSTDDITKDRIDPPVGLPLFVNLCKTARLLMDSLVAERTQLARLQLRLARRVLSLRSFEGIEGTDPRLVLLAIVADLRSPLCLLSEVEHVFTAP